VVAFNWLELNNVPYVIAAGVAHVMTGVAWFIVSVMLAVAVVKSVLSLGVKTAVIVQLPAPNTVPAGAGSTGPPLVN
jgi:hypothetical protein